MNHVAALAQTFTLSHVGLLEVFFTQPTSRLFLLVIRSARLKPDSVWLTPVHQYLADYPHELIYESEEDRPDMRGGKAIRSVYEIGGGNQSENVPAA